MAVFSILITIIGWVKANQTLLLAILTGLFGFEQWLASTEVFKASSTFQLIFNFTNGVMKILKLILKLAGGQAQITFPPQDNLTPAQQMEKAIEVARTIRGPETPPALQESTDAAIASQALSQADISTAEKLAE